MTGAGVVSHNGEVISGGESGDHNEAVMTMLWHGGVGHGWDGYGLQSIYSTYIYERLVS